MRSDEFSRMRFSISHSTPAALLSSANHREPGDTLHTCQYTTAADWIMASRTESEAKVVKENGIRGRHCQKGPSSAITLGVATWTIKSGAMRDPPLRMAIDAAACVWRIGGTVQNRQRRGRMVRS
jgi:hypothetical protein